MALAKLLTFGLLTASIAYWVLCIIGALKFLSRRPGERAEGTPPATILKPVRGLDPDLADNCRAVCRQDYPVYQVIFGVSDPQDPAIPLLQSVLAESPGERHRLVIGPEVYGPNRKVSLLQQMLPFAAQEARRQGYRLVLSDYPVACILGRSQFSGVFGRLLR